MCVGAVDVTPETAADATLAPDVAGTARAHAVVSLGVFDRAHPVVVAALRTASTVFRPHVPDTVLANGCNA